MGGARSMRAVEGKPRLPDGGDERRAIVPVLAERADGEGWRGSGQVPFLLAERAR